MKNIISLLVSCTLFFSCTKFYYNADISYHTVAFEYNKNHPLIDSIQYIIDKNIKSGIPAMQVILKDKDGWCNVTRGLASIEKNMALSPDLTSWLYSITKIYTATLCLLAVDKKLISLDQSIQTYLSPAIFSHIPSSDKITIKMLLNHSSGIKNFTTDPAYQLSQLNTPLQQSSIIDQLKIIYDKKLLFTPGTDFYYSNSNYALLQLILENVFNKSYKSILSEHIILPLHLTNTHYELPDDQVLALGTPNFYFERYNNGQLENVTKWHNSIAQSLKGYGGIIAHGTDVIQFYSALLKGKIISEESMTQMKSWITGKGHDEPDYGLGLEYYEYIKGIPTYGHEGDDLGGTTQILYIPSKDTYVFITINAGRQIFGDYLFKTSGAKIDICKFLSKP